MGFHNLVIESRGGRAESLIISAPKRMYSDAEKEREWGLFVPLYAVHSRESWGAGNFKDWEKFTRWASEAGARVVASLPLLPTFLGKKPFDPSPYSPASRLFWNEFFVDVEAVPEFARSERARALVGSASFRRRLEKLRSEKLVEYRAGMKLRREVLEILSGEFFAGGTPGWREHFDEFVKRRPELLDYARFRAATEQKGKPWHAWEAEGRAGKLREGDYAAEVVNYYSYCQWAADEQMAAVLEGCEKRKLKFYLDLPLGVHPDSYDAWRYKEFFAQGVNAGAPPDAFFTKGQDWGFPPLHPERMRELRYRYVIEYLRFQMQHTGMLRLDHVMGLNRLYWVPQGCGATDGGYVRYPAEELYAILALESHRYKCVLVGENLGTVPKETNRAMDRHKVEKMYVLQFAEAENGTLQEPEANEVASLNTHDVPPFAAQWNGKDIADRVQLGLLTRAEAAGERKRREKWKKDVVRALRRSGDLSKKEGATAREVLRGVLNYLGRSRAKTVLVNLEDLWLEEKPQNVPGTSEERPNWRRKAKLGLEELFGSKEVGELLEVLMKQRGSSGCA